VRIDPYFARRQWRRCRLRVAAVCERVANGSRLLPLIEECKNCWAPAFTAVGLPYTLKLLFGANVHELVQAASIGSRVARYPRSSQTKCPANGKSPQTQIVPNKTLPVNTGGGEGKICSGTNDLLLKPSPNSRSYRNPYPKQSIGFKEKAVKTIRWQSGLRRVNDLFRPVRAGSCAIAPIHLIIEAIPQRLPSDFRNKL